MSAPTPADVAGRTRRFFDVAGSPVAQSRVRTRNQAIAKAERLSQVLRRLAAGDESDLDLNLEAYRRAAWDLDGALDALDAALADEAGPPPPEPSRRHL